MLAALLLSAAGAGAQHRQDGDDAGGFARDGGREGRFGGPALANGDPSAIVAAEFAYGLLAREQGVTKAARKMGDADAVMFVPQAVNAQGWLKQHEDSVQPVSWSPHAIYVACDGSYAAATGNWRRTDGANGRFVTLWRLQKDGSYKWLIDWRDTATGAAAAARHDNSVEGKVADCPTGQRGPMADRDGMGSRAPYMDRVRRDKKRKLEIIRISDPPPADGQGQSDDGSLRWAWTSAEGAPATLRIEMRKDGATQTVIAEGGAAGAP